jgi:glucose-1-phosphate cytidylyltransferase
MKAVILAGGLGSRLAEETAVEPKPMGRPVFKPARREIWKDYLVG